MEEDQEVAPEWVGPVLASMGLFLLRLKGGDEEVSLLHCVSGGMMHLRVKNPAGVVLYQVSGKDPGELADQLGLACFHDLSPDRLRELHHQPLSQGVQLQAVK